MWLKYEPSDPDRQLVASFHTYNWTACASVTCWNQDVEPLAKSVPIVTGEFGEGDCSTSFVSLFMNWADAHNISYLAWDWEVPYSSQPTTCVSSSNSHNLGTNLMLLSNWNGEPNTSSPEGASIENHLHTLGILGIG